MSEKTIREFAEAVAAKQTGLSGRRGTTWKQDQKDLKNWIVDNFPQEPTEHPDDAAWKEVDRLITLASEQGTRSYEVYRGRHSGQWGVKDGQQCAQFDAVDTPGELCDQLSKMVEAAVPKPEQEFQVGDPVTIKQIQSGRQASIAKATLTTGGWRYALERVGIGTGTSVWRADELTLVVEPPLPTLDEVAAIAPRLRVAVGRRDYEAINSLASLLERHVAALRAKGGSP